MKPLIAFVFLTHLIVDPHPDGQGSWKCKGRPAVAVDPVEAVCATRGGVDGAGCADGTTVSITSGAPSGGPSVFVPTFEDVPTSWVDSCVHNCGGRGGLLRAETIQPSEWDCQCRDGLLVNALEP